MLEKQLIEKDKLLSNLDYHIKFCSFPYDGIVYIGQSICGKLFSSDGNRPHKLESPTFDFRSEVYPRPRMTIEFFRNNFCVQGFAF